jgi:phospholipase/carboxylesterase
MDRELEDLQAFLPPLLRSLEALGFAARHLHPPVLGEVLAALGDPAGPLRSVRTRLSGWPDGLTEARTRLEGAADEVLKAFDELHAAVSADSAGPAYRALRRLPRAQEALWPLASALAPLGRYFLEPSARSDLAAQARLARPAPGAGVLHLDNDYGSRGGYSLYLPESGEPDEPAPLVVALHGGSGHGRAFLWTWLPAARAAGAALIAPTSVGSTWSLQGADEDTPNLARILLETRARWPIDPTRLLLTGMSDGGTFAYLSGLQADSPFTHLAPVSAAFHPVLLALADPERLRGLPIQVVHGGLDWMFPIGLAREARDALLAAGAKVAYREIADLSHCYPREANLPLLDWLSGASGT